MTLHAGDTGIGFTCLIVVLLSARWTDSKIFLNKTCLNQFATLNNASIQVIGSDCPNNIVESAAATKYSNKISIYEVRFHLNSNGRIVDVIGDNLQCYVGVYIQFIVRLKPYVEKASKTCMRLNVKPKDQSSDVLYFNCLVINTTATGTLTINTYTNTLVQSLCPSVRQGFTENIFDLGCDLDLTSVYLDNCLRLDIRDLHDHTDLSKTIIRTFDPNNCVSTFSGSDLYRSGNQATLALPLNGNGTYKIIIDLICNASGEVSVKNFTKEIFINNENLCTTSHRVPGNPECHSLVSSTEPSLSPSVRASSSAHTSTDQSIYTVLSVVGLIGIVVLIVTVVKMVKSKKSESSRYIDQQQHLNQHSENEHQTNNANREELSRSSEIDMEDDFGIIDDCTENNET